MQTLNERKIDYPLNVRLSQKEMECLGVIMKVIRQKNLSAAVRESITGYAMIMQWVENKEWKPSTEDMMEQNYIERMNPIDRDILLRRYIDNLPEIELKRLEFFINKKKQQQEGHT